MVLKFASLLLFTQLSLNVYSNSLREFKVITFNILAPIWVDPLTYQASSIELLNKDYRRTRIISFLLKESEHADIFALQETTQSEFKFLAKALKEKYVAFQANHNINYWYRWKVPAVPWEENGVALFLKTSVFRDIKFFDVPLSNTGNHAAIGQAEFKNNLGVKIRIASVHLDADEQTNRLKEIKSLFQAWPILQMDTVDIIAGDFNQNNRVGPLFEEINANFFKDALNELNKDEPTHPYMKSFDAVEDEDEAFLEHILFRNVVAENGFVISSNLWTLFPDDEKKRINANFEMCGSDHFPVFATFQLALK